LGVYAPSHAYLEYAVKLAYIDIQELEIYPLITEAAGASFPPLG
jgi:hypothetical protein